VEHSDIAVGAKGVSTIPALQILRAGTPGPSPERWGTAFLLEVGGDLIMVDCGHGATQRLVDAGRQPKHVSHLFITHHHSDHIVDFPCLFLARWNQCIGSEPPLRIFGPPPTEEATRTLFGDAGVFAPDITARINHPASKHSHTRRGGSLPRPGPRYEAHDVEAGATIDGGSWTATCAEVQHMQPFMTCLAWRFDWDGGSCAFTGDATRGEPLMELISGVDTLVANVVLRQDRLSPEMATCIFGTLDAAEVARDAGARRLVLAHLTNGLFGERQEAGVEMAEIYDGEIIFCEELMILEQ